MRKKIKFRRRLKLRCPAQQYRDSLLMLRNFRFLLHRLRWKPVGSGFPKTCWRSELGEYLTEIEEKVSFFAVISLPLNYNFMDFHTLFPLKTDCHNSICCFKPFVFCSLFVIMCANTKKPAHKHTHTSTNATKRNWNLILIFLSHIAKLPIFISQPNRRVFSECCLWQCVSEIF